MIARICALCFVMSLITSSCLEVPCKQDNAYNFDRRGRPIKLKQKKSDPPYILMKRCPKSQCQTRKIHCHGNIKYRGTGIFRLNHNPAIGQDVDINQDKE
ncbi:MAG: hypothetical protein SFY32_09425 [Bacteroidota bacterium]|nr:hypothetical protein [Bacteroidota bacterium]